MLGTKKRSVLRGEMAKHGLTLAEMAKVLELSSVSLSNKINGRVDFTLSEAIKVLNFFNSLGESHTIQTLFDIE